MEPTLAPTHERVFAALQEEFCPPLDSSLVAALLVDIDFESGSGAVQQAVDGMKETLQQLAKHADINSALSTSSGIEDDIETCTTNSVFGSRARSSNTSPESAIDSQDRDEAFNTFLMFLQAALPEVPTEKLMDVLDKAWNEAGNDEPDMWEIIAAILSQECTGEMEERGFDGLVAVEEDEALARRLAEEEGEWPEDFVVQKEEAWVHVQPKATKKKQQKQKPAAAVKITFGNVRQQATITKKDENGDVKPPAPDRWTQVVSLSSLLSTHFPSYPLTFFQSQLHSPNYPDLYSACIAILQKIASSPLLSPENDEKDEPTADDPRRGAGKSKARVRTVTDRDRHPPVKHPTSSSSSSSVSEDSPPSDDGQDDEQKSREKALLYNLLDILLPQYDLYPGSSHHAADRIEDAQRTDLISEIQLVVKATKGREDDALDLVKLLRSLDGDRKDRFPELMEEWYKNGVVASYTGEGRGGRKRGVSYADSIGGGATKPVLKVVSGKNEMPNPCNIPLPTSPVLSRAQVSDPTPKGKNKPSPFQWQAVPTKKALEKRPDTILPHLPTYVRDVNGIKRRGKGALSSHTPSVLDDSGYIWRNGLAVPPNSVSSSSKNASEAAELEYRRKIGDNMRRREELLREAARMWSRGSIYGANIMGGSKAKNGRGRANVGGEVAWYFAERAREFQEMAKKECLNAARAMVLRKRDASGNKYCIDLHGTTVAEAVVIVEEILEEMSNSQRELRIITGRGSHSVNQTSVLKPALKKKLTDDGWKVSQWDAGLTVTGKR